MRRFKLTVLTATIIICLFLTAHADPYADATVNRQSMVNKTYFGTHFHRLELNHGENKLLTKWPGPMVGSIRLWDSGTRWADILPKAGQWEFDRMDTFVGQAVANQATILYTLGSTPRWVSTRPDEKCPYGLGCASEPVRMAHWEEYVRRVVRRYRGRIFAYELWNEPNFSDIARDRGQSGFYTGSIAQMVEMARIARKVLDENDPDVVLSTPGFVNGSDRLDMFLAAGGKQYVQAIAYHFYSENSKYMANELVNVRQVMQRNGVGHLPLWNTETGVEVLGPNSPPSGISANSQVEAAEKLAQYLILGASAGLQHYYQYAWDNERSGMISPTGVRQLAWDSYVKIQLWLIDAKMQGCVSIPPSGVRCQGERAGQRFLIVWAEKDGMHSIAVPLGQRAVSVENLFATSPQPISGHDRPPKLMLSNEPMQILLEPQP